MAGNEAEEALDERTAIAVARMIGLDLPPACLPGVVFNMHLLAEHAARIEALGTAESLRS